MTTPKSNEPARRTALRPPSRPPTRPRRWRAAAAVALLAVALPAAAGALTLRVNDSRGEPGGLVAVVLRTYAPRPIGQGQICFRAHPPLAHAAGTGPLATLEGWAVFSAGGDATGQATFDPLTQDLLLEFSSPSASVNASDGPLAVAYFRLDGALTSGQEFVLDVDLADTVLMGQGGEVVPLAIQPGRLRVRGPGAPLGLDADGDTVAPGQVAALGASTEELAAIGEGQIGLRYDPAVMAGPPAVTIDPRYGAASFTVEEPQAGLLIVSFTSPDGSLGMVPGGFLAALFYTDRHTPVGTHAPVTLDPDLTFLRDAQGADLPLGLGSDELVFAAPEPVFSDGFATGDLSAWSVAVP
jgi:hypothetical protein